MATFSGADFNRILLYPIKDKDWFVKLCLQGALLFLLCFSLVGMPLYMGYMMAFVRRGINNEESLPDWSEWGRYWRDGWRILAVNLAYISPVFIAWLLAALTFVGVSVLTSFNEEYAGLYIISFSFFIIGYALTFVFSLLMNFVGMSTQPVVALGLPLKSAFNIKGYVWPYIKANFVSILLTMVIAYLGGLIASLGMFVFFIGLFFTYPYAIAVVGYATGQVYRLSSVKVK